MKSRHDVRIKRVYDLPSEIDGVRVLVDRLWPRRGNLTEGLYIGLDYEKVCFAQKKFS
ncbi:DUF488 family protein [Acetobacter lambici]|uniref:DUF488 family protein, N3 subclade n=1 Tax=Acetobacter lambici TaxID=1332824 RepID=UPI00140D22F0|nr:DUF488 family protein [Acetobacter lambici]NHO58330.1 DUF488 family protein [Acetobacter lambici]